MDAHPEGDVDAVVVGAGFGGLYMVHRLLAGGFSVQAFEAGSGVGGTWFWNRYPGAGCDIESIDYSYSFSAELQDEWTWSSRYAPQAEILRYLDHVADRFDLRRHIRLDTTVVSAAFDDDTALWTVVAHDGTTVSARFLMMAGGNLSVARVPSLPGADSYLGRTLHTADWPADGVDLTGRRVGIIGTGSSGVHVTPLIAQQAAHTTVFQRTANYTMPARNAPLTPDFLAEVRARYPQLREIARTTRNGTQRLGNPASALSVGDAERRQRFEEAWQRGGNGIIATFGDLITNRAANDTLADFLRAKIRALVHDPRTADVLTSQDYPVGAKRLCVGTDYYESFNRDDVSLVDLRRTPIQALTPAGIRTSDGEHELDVIVYATGFDAITGSILRVAIRGRDGASLRHAWADGPHTYLGLASARFPNLFFLAGPGSPSVFANVVAALELHVDWIGDHLEYLRSHGLTTTEVDTDAQQQWVEHVGDLAARTLLPEAASWYTGANVPGKPRVFMPYVEGLNVYRAQCTQIAADGYPGFVCASTARGSLSRAAPAQAGVLTTRGLTGR